MQKEVDIELERALQLTAREFGNSSHIIVSKELAGKKAKIIFGKIIKKTSKKITFDFKDLEILTRKITRFGNGAHIILPREYSDKKIILELENE